MNLLKAIRGFGYLFIFINIMFVSSSFARRIKDPVVFRPVVIWGSEEYSAYKEIIGQEIATGYYDYLFQMAEELTLRRIFILIFGEEISFRDSLGTEIEIPFSTKVPGINLEVVNKIFGIGATERDGFILLPVKSMAQHTIDEIRDSLEHELSHIVFEFSVKGHMEQYIERKKDIVNSSDLHGIEKFFLSQLLSRINECHLFRFQINKMKEKKDFFFNTQLTKLRETLEREFRGKDLSTPEMQWLTQARFIWAYTAFIMPLELEKIEGVTEYRERFINLYRNYLSEEAITFLIEQPIKKINRILRNMPSPYHFPTIEQLKEILP